MFLEQQNRTAAVSRNTGRVAVAVIGAGPYGLSIAAHLSCREVTFRIFGEPMEGWLGHMPKGMLLKSEGFASNLYSPDNSFSLRQYCAERRIAYSDIGTPVKIETFMEYGAAFQQRFVPRVERKKLVMLEHGYGCFRLRFNDGDVVHASNVVLAVGMAAFGYVPDVLTGLPAALVSHASCHSDLGSFKGRRLAVIGGGSSAIDIAYLAQEAGAEVELIARRPELRFHNPPSLAPRTRWQNIRYPLTGMGPGLRARVYTDAPLVFHSLPQEIRRRIVADFAPPEGGWFSRDRLMNHVSLLLGQTITGVQLQKGELQLQLRGADGARKTLTVDHAIAATGYRVDVARLDFLSPEIQGHLRLANQIPTLSSKFESSVRGLYFVGLPSALSFGPMMRFALGAQYTARRLANVFSRASTAFVEKSENAVPVTS